MPFINGGHIWLVLILVAVLVIFGPGKLPELGSAVGRTIKEFRRSTQDLKDELAKPQESVATETVTPAAKAAPAQSPELEPVRVEAKA